MYVVIMAAFYKWVLPNWFGLFLPLHNWIFKIVIQFGLIHDLTILSQHENDNFMYKEIVIWSWEVL